ncbi:MAG: DUF3868 domain-containing protein [Candidatus Cryptobacteroides sp.]
MKKSSLILAVLICIGQLALAAVHNEETNNPTKVLPVQTDNGTASDSTSKNPVPDVSVDYFLVEHSGKYMNVEMNLDLTDLKVRSNRAILITPRLVNGTDSLDLASIGIYGRDRYYIYNRNGVSALSGEEETSFKAKDKPAGVSCNNVVPYEDWMDGSTLKLCRSDWGCCRTKVAEYEGELASYTEPEPELIFFPELIFVRPEADSVKIRTLEGSAFIDFPVDRTEIYPEYRRNTAELGKIQATIDSVRLDEDVTIKLVWLKGFASPESPYKHNTDLAIGRTASIKNYICQLYHFDEKIIETDYEPEDWAGLKKYVSESNITDREGILQLIDSDMEPDAKESRIKRTYPEQYRFMLQHFYPALRHTDYKIKYEVRTFTDIEKIKKILATAPQKLSLNEIYLVAQTCEPGTPEFTEVFETAVRMFPDDETANLNAANAAIRRDDLGTAQRYLAKAGESPEADYARGALAVRMKDYEAAAEHLTKAKEKGLDKAAELLEWVDNALRQENK